MSTLESGKWKAESGNEKSAVNVSPYSLFFTHYLLLVTCYLLLSTCFGFAQEANKTITVTGQELIGSVQNGESIREVNGDVVLTQGNVVITCNKAIQYLARNDAKLIGNVIVTQDTLTIYTDEGFYYGNERRTFSDKGVKLDDKKVILTATVGEYFFNEDKADFRRNVKLFDTISTLTSDRLLYFRREDRAIAFGNVKIADKENIIYADSLIHFRKVEESHGFGNINIKNKTNHSTILGGHMEDYRARNYSLIDSLPLLIQIDTTFSGDTVKTIDTLLIKSKVMKAYRDTSNRFIAIDSVEILRGEFASKNDYTIYFRDEENIITNKTGDESAQPVLWFENSQLSGDSVKIFLKERQIQKIDIINNTLIASYNENFRQRFDQISGDTIMLFFDSTGIKRNEVYSNVLSIYYLYDDQEPSGLMKASAQSSLMNFDQKKIISVKLFGTPNSEYHPETIIQGKEKEYFLPSFILFENRPEKEKLFTPQLQMNFSKGNQ